MVELESFENLRFYELMTELFRDQPCMNLSNTEGQTLFLKHTPFIDIGTLPLCCEVSHKYLQIQDEDIVILNDPFSGGSAINAPTFVMGLGLKPGKADFLLATRIHLKTHAGPHTHIDAEGLRIPPSPLVSQGKINEALVDALSSHPQIDKNFITVIKTEVEKLFGLRKLFLESAKAYSLDLSKAFVRNYLKHTEKLFVETINEWPEGEETLEEYYSDKEFIRLQIQLSSGSVKFDFTGSSKGERLFLTDSATYGICVGALMSMFPRHIPINSGMLSRIHIVAPRGSIVNASFPQPVRLGHSDGALALRNIVYDTMGKLHSQLVMGRGASSNLKYEIDFGNGLFFSDSIPSGYGANPKRKGITYDLSIYTEDRFRVEKTESQYPIQFLQSSLRNSSGGEGQWRGGHGMTRSLKVLAPGKLKWSYLSPNRKPEGVNGGKSALPAEIIWVKNSSDPEKAVKTVLGFEGEQTLEPGDTVTFLSPGGGGFGSSLS
jgi:N-methylhydantoinase B